MKSTKNIASAAMAAATLLSALHVCAETTTPRWGDVNRDEVAELSDAQLILLYYVQVGLGGRTDGPDIDITYADVNLDGSVDVSDAQLVLIKYVQEMSGLTYFLPAERGGTVKVLSQKWAVYSAPTASLEAHLVDVIRPGETFEIVQAISSEWFEVKLGSGEKGYLHISKAEFDKNLVWITAEEKVTETTTTTTTTATETTTTATATETTTTATETTTTTMTKTTTTATETTVTTTATETTTSQTETTVTTEAPKPKETFNEGDVIIFQKTAWNVYDSELKGIIGWLRNGEELTIKSVKTLHDDVQLLEVVWVRDDEERQGFIYNGEVGSFVKK